MVISSIAAVLHFSFLMENSGSSGHVAAQSPQNSVESPAAPIIILVIVPIVWSLILLGTALVMAIYILSYLHLCIYYLKYNLKRLWEFISKWKSIDHPPNGPNQIAIPAPDVV